MKTPRPPALPWLALGPFLLACSSTGDRGAPRASTPSLTSEPVLVTSADARALPATEQVEANWKERLEQPYVFLEHTGDYRELGRAMQELLRVASRRDWEVSGAPFALFYDDPGTTPVESLRSRACLPVAGDVGSRPDEVGFEVLPRAMVVYARVPGAYPELPRVYPALFAYLTRLGWSAGGPIREVYLTDPGAVASWDELVAEVQIPWTAGR